MGTALTDEGLPGAGSSRDSPPTDRSRALGSPSTNQVSENQAGMKLGWEQDLPVGPRISLG